MNRTRANRALMLLMAALLAQAPASAQAETETPAETVAQQAQEAQQVQEVQVVQEVPALPAAFRESTLSLPFDAPFEATSLVLAQDLPAGTTFVSGSARLGDEALPDPLVGASGRLYWVLTNVQSGTVSLRVAHEGELGTLPPPALLARFRGERTELLSGRLDTADFAAARPLDADARLENLGAIKLPLAGTVVRDRDQVSVSVVAPLDAEPNLTVNGEAVSTRLIGGRTIDEEAGTIRLDYFGVSLRPGPNELRFGDETITVLLAGSAATVEARPDGAGLVADGFSPVRLRLRVLDESGVGATEATLTVRSSIEPRGADADPSRGGYQIRLVEGEGVLELPPQATPTRWLVGVVLGDEVKNFGFDVAPDTATVGIGHASVAFGVAPFEVTALRASAYYEGMIGAGKLYAAASSNGLPTGQNPNVRFSTFGDASSETVPLQGIDPVAARYEHPDFWAQYRAAPVPISVFSVGENLTALSVRTRGDVYAGGFVAAVPNDRVSEIVVPDGTRLLRLSRGGLAPDSETIDLVVREAISGKELRRTRLRRLDDYTLDPATGTLEFPRALLRVDEGFNEVGLEATYRLLDGRTNRGLAFGAEVGSVGDRLSAAAAVVSLDGKLSSGAKVAYKDGDFGASAGVAYANGIQFSVDAAANLGVVSTSAGLRYQDASYNGLGAFAPGVSARASVKPNLSGPFSVGLDAAYRNTFTSWGGSVTASARYDFQAFSVGLGARAGFGDSAGVSVLGSFGVRLGGLDLELGHTHSLDGTAATQLGVGFALNDATRITARSDLDWKTAPRSTVGITSRLGDVNVSAQYELPTADGGGNKARFGADTGFALTPNLTLGVNTAYLLDPRGGPAELSAGAALRFGVSNLSATLAADAALKGDVLKTVVRGGVTGTVTPELTLSADGLAEFSDTPGARASVAAAYRSGSFNTLGYLRYQDGLLAVDGASLTGELAAEYRTPSFALRGGLASRTLLADPGSFTVQPSLGATLYLTEVIGVGVGARALYQPSTNSAVYGFGVEGSVRVLPGAWASVGYNPSGFQGLAGTHTKQGLYFRLDLVVDDAGNR